MQPCQNAARRRQGHRLKNVLEHKSGTAPHAQRPTCSRARPCRRQPNAHGEIYWRRGWFHMSEAHSKPPVAFELLAAIWARTHMLANINAIRWTDSSVEITGEETLRCATIHRALPLVRCAANAGIGGTPAEVEGLTPGTTRGEFSLTRPRSCAECASRECASRSPWSNGSNSSRKARRPRRIRDFTVPTDTSSTSATSSYDSPSRSRRITALRKTSGTDCNARRTANCASRVASFSNGVASKSSSS